MKQNYLEKLILAEFFVIYKINEFSTERLFLPTEEAIEQGK